MKEDPAQLGPREQQIAELLLQGCDNSEIARQLKMARRTVKAHFNRLFLKFGINSGIKRVKLATLLYRRQLCMEASAMASGFPASESSGLSNLSPRDSRTVKSRMRLAPRNTSSKTIFASSMTNSDCGTGSSLPYGTKLADTKAQHTPEVLENWERSIMGLDPGVLKSRHL
jgi:Bacterial regulatory proteins, luxR family